MILDQIKVHALRSIKAANLNFHPKYNYIIGQNGTGKTTLLEAIYILGSGHSFKTREISPLIQQNEQALVIYGKGEDTTLSISKSLNSTTMVKINGQICTASSKLAYQMPCQVYYQDIFQIMDSGPGLRRSMIDWGVFHVKHDYLNLWKQYKYILKQRNSLLKQRPGKSALEPWDCQLAEVGETIADMRFNYLQSLMKNYQDTLNQLCDFHISLNYYKGWDKKKSGCSLKEALLLNREKDIHRGFTSVGIHQADILVESEDTQAKKILSRGQQKIALIALKLSQSKMLSYHCIHLMDDIFAELDAYHLEKLASFISKSGDQFFFTVLPHDLSKLEPFPQGEAINLPVTCALSLDSKVIA